MSVTGCECEMAGHCDRHSVTKSNREHTLCGSSPKYWNAWEEGRMTGATAPAIPRVLPSSTPSVRPDVKRKTRLRRKSKIGTRLKGIIAKAEPGVMTCGTCKAMIEELDGMTVKEVRRDMDRIVSDIASRAPQQAPKLWQRIAVRVDQAIHLGRTEKKIRGWVTEAISRPVPKHRKRSLVTMPLSRAQKRLHAAAIAAPPPRPFPFTDTPVRSMIWHVWPVEGWLRHIERIKDLAATCEGKRIIGLSISPDSESAYAVRDALGAGFEYLEFENKGQGDGTGSGEGQTLRAALPLLDATDPNGVTVYGHCKGVRPHTRDMEAVHLWCDLMWEMVALNHEQSTAFMEAGYNMVGAFRTFGVMPLHPVNMWHYSGTFFQFRTAAILRDGIPDVKGSYGGTEAFPGDHVPAHEAACVFLDGLGFKAPYDINNWPKWIDQAFEWEINRIGGPRTEQHQRELLWFLDRLEGVQSMLVIGSRAGGLEYQIGQRYPDMHLISLDMEPLEDNAAPALIQADSHDPAIQEMLRNEYDFDAVFIDGDHTLEGVTEDWEFAKTLHPDTIYFHDIADALKHRREDCHVDKLWNEIKAEHRTDEKIVGCGWGGIGEVTWQR